MQPIRILYVNGGIMSRGGIESFMMSYYRNIDKDLIQIDFIVHGFEKGAYDDEIYSMGGKIYRVPVKSKNYFGNINALRKIFKSNEYKIVHSHMDAMSMIVLKLAKECGIPIRIAHSHNTNHLTKNILKYVLNEYARLRIKKYATHYFACSMPAAVWLFGKKSVDEGKVKIIKNAIDLDKYKFNVEVRDKIRQQLGYENVIVIGHVGRFDYQKNHLYLIEIFSKIVEANKNFRLVLVGSGHLYEKIVSYINKKKLNDYIKLLGARDDVHEILNAFDIFVLPSLFEGLSISLLEAQINGLFCFTSLTTPKEVNISGKVQYLNYKKSDVKTWVEKIESNKPNNRNISIDIFRNAGYDILYETVKLQNLYLNYLGDYNEHIISK